MSAAGLGDDSLFNGNPFIIITDVFATGYYCVYDSELAGSQTITKTISNNAYILKASFLFGGRGVAMQGTGKTAPNGDYIKYTGGAGCFVHISGPDAGRNLKGQWVENPQVLRNRYARLGITDFTGFGNLALSYPDRATFSRTSSVAGSSGQTLTPWLSISVDPSLIPLGQTCKLSFKNSTAKASGVKYSTFRADDIGGSIKGKHIEIYLGEGQSAIDEWNRTGGNRLVSLTIAAQLPHR
jgi:3D (Asp-Asp-Asp) domain-containing protein